jgi:hypothetical protein
VLNQIGGCVLEPFGLFYCHKKKSPHL